MNNEEGKSLVAAIEDPNTGRPLGDAVRGVALRERGEREASR